MGIIKEYIGKGWGKTLLKAQIRSIEQVALEVYQKNIRAISLFKSLGFEIEGVKKIAIKLRDEYDDIILMGKFL